jgi:adenylosuccinate synthase
MGKVVIVVGGQFGGEGKGKVTAHLCRRHNFHAVVRCGGPNSGHTIIFNNKPVVLRQLPAGVVSNNINLFLGAGCLINLKVLLDEIRFFNVHSERLYIDKHAVIIENEDEQEEIRTSLNKKIGSTCSGVGVAVAKRILRREKIRLAKDTPELAQYISDVSEELSKYYERGKNIIIEGTQGFGLSLYHSPFYPFTTSRDTTAAAFISECGISPLIVTDIVMVLRTFPIRVGGNSGPLIHEIDWKTIQDESGYPYMVKEFTTVTGRLRRVGRFDINLVKKAVIINRPNSLALMGIDYLDYKDKGKTSYDNLTDKAKKFILHLEKELNVEVKFIGTGPLDNEIIEKLQ